MQKKDDLNHLVRINSFKNVFVVLDSAGIWDELTHSYRSHH